MNTFLKQVSFMLSMAILMTIPVESSPVFSTNCDLDTVAQEIARKRPLDHPCAGWTAGSEKKLSRRACKACLGAMVPTCQRKNTQISDTDIKALQAYCETLTNPK